MEPQTPAPSRSSFSSCHVIILKRPSKINLRSVALCIVVVIVVHKLNTRLTVDHDPNYADDYSRRAVSLKQKKFLVMISYAEHLSGLVTFPQNLALLLKSKGYNVELYAHPNNWIQPKVMEHHIPVSRREIYGFDPKSLKFYLFKPLQLLPTLRKSDYIVSANAFGFNPLLSMVHSKLLVLQAGPFTRLNRLPLIGSNYQSAQTSIYKAKATFDDRRNDYRVFAAFVETELKPIVMKSCSTRQRRIKILMMGRYVPFKNYEQALEIIAHLQSRLVHHTVELNIIGQAMDIDGDYLSTLEAKVRQLNLTQVVTFHFHSPENDRQIWKTVADADVLLHTALIEFRGLVLFESMMRGQPVFCYDIGGLSETMLSGVNGFAVSPLTTRALSDALHEYITDGAVKCRITAKTQLSTMRRFNNELQMDQFLRYLL